MPTSTPFETPVRLARVSTTDAIVSNLKRRIESGEFAPGTLLPSERELQAQLGVSRLALREGLARLSALGIIRVAHGKGSFVATEASRSALRDVLAPILLRKDARRFHDLFRARALIEGEIAAEAASRRTRKDLEALEALLAPSSDVLDNPRAFAELDFRFHRTVARIAGNVFLALMWDGLSSHILGFLMEFAKERQDRVTALLRHRPLLDAIRDQDVEAARTLGHDHVAPCLAHCEERLLQEENAARAARRQSEKKTARPAARTKKSKASGQ